MNVLKESARVEAYLESLLCPPDPVLDAALRASEAAGLPAIQVTALEGQLLMLLARATGAGTILEIGTLGGYSTIWLARALPPGGRLVTLEADARHAEVALRYDAGSEVETTAPERRGQWEVRRPKQWDELPWAERP